MTKEPRQLRHSADGRFARAVSFADAHRLRFVVQQSDGGVMAVNRPVAPFLNDFAVDELERVLALIDDFHASLLRQVAGQRQAVRAVNDRVQELVGQLELVRAGL